ncbi:hypothetical protein D9M68_749840 [compost metagenome]
MQKLRVILDSAVKPIEVPAKYVTLFEQLGTFAWIAFGIGGLLRKREIELRACSGTVFLGKQLLES